MSDDTKTPRTLWDKIQEANKILKDGEPTTEKGKGNISKDTHSAFGGIGYEVQYVVDAVNEALGPEGWHYEVQDLPTDKGTAVAITLYIGDITHGTTYGGTNITNDADGRKAAISDGLKKAFASWSIGNRAFRGELPGQEKANADSSKQPTSKGSVKNAAPADDLNRKDAIGEIKKWGARAEQIGAATPEDKKALAEKILGKGVALENAPIAKLRELQAAIRNVVDQAEGATAPPDPFMELIHRINNAVTLDELKAVWDSFKAAEDARIITPEEGEDIAARYKVKEAQLKAAAAKGGK